MKTKKEPPQSRVKKVLREIAYYAILIAAILLFRVTIAENYVIPSGSMEPTLKVGDYLFALKCSYGFRIPFTDAPIVTWSKVKRGDIVIFPSVEGPRPWIFGIEKTDKLIKRVVGLPGDVIRIRNDRVYINNAPLERHFSEHHRGLYDLDDAKQKKLFEETIRDGLKHYVFQYIKKHGGSNWPEVTVKEGHVFCMGDNRDQSRDSRYFGQVPIPSILGKAGIIYMSLDKEHGFPWRIRHERLGRIVR